MTRTLRDRPEKPEVIKNAKKETGSKLKEEPQRCNQCRQMMDDPDLKMFIGDPEDAVCLFFFGHFCYYYFVIINGSLVVVLCLEKRLYMKV